ncbi:PucR family transcriptional regulator ligand-binding domain-containing protein [Mesobacillus maritimus]|uniref:PucR family transcriptional regulator n=1 Tax=Mesobacillus maritimus TaxID=1643336 RepID=UPI00203B9AB6|nr:PucR family transcriptional regulator [Mesobacillus maritimus]MCM3584396.1 PucR family transcriptional regulator ligand-binding domain-containing protein [Mesobacillus maritimus]MCM3669187.1 PucR family transcriptional regulator ligand-binding domain-containing protein [Mesobacillus maritimus]
MKLTIAEIWNMEVMQGAVVRSGQCQMEERYVQWISVIEMPVENFVRKNELVLSTGIGCGKEVQTFKSFVKDIIKSGASALMIALGRHVYDIPKEVIKLAEKEQFIIIELPWEIRFANIIAEVMRDLNNRQQWNREKSEKVQQHLLKLILQEKDLNSILNYIEKQIGFPLILTDHTGMIQELHQQSHQITKNWNQYVMKGLIPVVDDSALLPHDPLFHKVQSVRFDGYNVLQLPIIQVASDVQGFLYVLLPPEMEIETYVSSFVGTVLEHATTTIALWLSRKNAIETTKIRLRSDFVQELAHGNIHSSEQAHSRARLLGYNIKLPYLCIVGLPENLQNLFEKSKRLTDSYESWFENMIRYIEEEIYYSAQSLKREVMLTYQEEIIVLFLETIPGDRGNHPTAFLDLIERRLRNLLPDVVLSWGVGDYYQNLQGFKLSYDHAKLALSLGRRKNGPGRRTFHEHTKMDRILLTISKNEEMKEVIYTTVKPLLLYDQQRNMDLIGTISMYHACHGNVSQTARALNLHRQSLLYRLRKIESLTGLSLLDPEEVFLLELCIKIWKLGSYIENSDQK